MNETATKTTSHKNAPCRPDEIRREYRPTFSIYHPNSKGTGGAMKMRLFPASSDNDGFIMLDLARQKTVACRTDSRPTFATFDWENKLAVKLDFSDLCKMLQVFRGECESIEDGRGLYHTHASSGTATRIVLRHLLEPITGYSLEIYRNTRAHADDDRSARILLTPWEALGVSLSIEDSIGVICFGIPKAAVRDTQTELQNHARIGHEAAA